MTASRPDQNTTPQNITPVVPATAVKEEAPIPVQEKLPTPETVQQQPEIPMESEKIAHPTVANGDLNNRPSARDGPLPALPKEEPITQSAPVIPPIVAAPLIPAMAETSKEVEEPVKDNDGDINMADADIVLDEVKETPSVPPQEEVSGSKQALPPPPPVPQSPSTSNEGVMSPPEPAKEEMKWLLPPITDRFKGKKCLVLDLDETLVHSSFKVCTAFEMRITEC